MTTPDLGDVLRWQPDPTTSGERYVCRHCGCLVASDRAYVHGEYHQQLDDLLRRLRALDLGALPTDAPADLPAPGPGGTGP